MKKKTCICILSVKPSVLAYSFYKTLKNELYDVLIIADDESYVFPNYDGEIPIITVPVTECIEAGYKGSVRISPWNEDAVYSRDKALFYFAKKNLFYDYIWFIEEDVFIPDLGTLITIDNIKSSQHADLLCSDCISQDKKWVHWKFVLSQAKIPPPYYRSMVCACRCSRRLLTAIDSYASQHKKLLMDEVMFTTLAMQHNMTIFNPSNLSTIWWSGKGKNWNHINKHNLYHPVKSFKLQHQFREMLKLNEAPYIDNLYHCRID